MQEGGPTDRWLIKVTDQHLSELRPDMRDLGTLSSNEQGERYLVFRDGFVALKVASQLGLPRQVGRTVASIKSEKSQPIMTLDNGDMLVADSQ